MSIRLDSLHEILVNRLCALAGAYGMDPEGAEVMRATLESRLVELASDKAD